ncbi:MAG: hypothetical protein WCC74_03445 [Minisyncoccia bacterium]
MKIVVYSSDNELDASITKGYLEANGILASIATGADSLGLNPRVLRGPNVPYSVFVEEDKLIEAKEILNKRTLNN